MSTSYNGWSASPSLPTRPLVVAGEAFVPGVRDDADVFTVLQYVAQQMHERVEPIVRDDWHQGDDWGFSYRPTTGDSSTMSCHASGTAIDYNATRHPYDVPTSRNFTAAQIATVHDIIADLPIVWGGDYRYHPDAMHFEIMGSRSAVAAAAARIRKINTRDGFDMAEISDLRNLTAPLSDKLDLLLQRTEGLRVAHDQIIATLDALDEAVSNDASKDLVRRARDQVLAAINPA